MYKILIVDAIKPSLVMSSEVLKDYLSSVLILTATSGSQALKILSQTRPDLCLVDFDLPDADGPALILAMREIYNGPILMTAYPDKIVEEAVQKELFAYSDSSSWIAKPIKANDIIDKIEHYLIKQRRFLKRFEADIPAIVIAKAEGRGKRAPKTTGQVINLGLGGACVSAKEKIPVTKSAEVIISMLLPTVDDKLYNQMLENPSSLKKALNKKHKKTKIKYADTKIKAKIAWYKNDKIGIQFLKLNNAQKKSLEYYLRFEAGNEIP